MNKRFFGLASLFVASCSVSALSMACEQFTIHMPHWKKTYNIVVKANSTSSDGKSFQSVGKTKSTFLNWNYADYPISNGGYCFSDFYGNLNKKGIIKTTLHIWRAGKSADSEVVQLEIKNGKKVRIVETSEQPGKHINGRFVSKIDFRFDGNHSR